MLYLFGSGAWKGIRKVVKIGYTRDLEKRKNQYRLHNPLGEIISTREGSELDELRLHLRLYDFKVEFLDEWFYDEQPVFEVFEQSFEEIDEWLWKHRSETLLFPQIPLPGTLKRKLLDELQKKHRTITVEGEKLL